MAPPRQVTFKCRPPPPQKIINSPNILCLSSLVLASLHEQKNRSRVRICIVVLFTVTDSTDSRFDIHFIWHSNYVYKTWYPNLYEMNDWETSSILALARSSRNPFLLILFRGTSEPCDSNKVFT